MNKSFLNAAIEYTERGWLVFPCKPGLKVPAVEHGVRAATRDIATITAWWERWPNANVALACGPGSGVYVVDVDYDADKGIDGWASLKAFPDMPVTVRQDSPRGGGHFLFKTDTPPANKNSFRRGIDIRSDGYYILLPPSVHPNGISYQWTDGFGPDDVQLSEYPDFMRPELERRKYTPPWERSSSPPPPVKEGATPIIDRAILYLRDCAPAIQGSAGHDALLWAARSMVVGFDLDDATALGLLWNEFNPRCVPQWDKNNPTDVKDFERKVREARSTPSEKPRGWLLVDKERAAHALTYTDDQFAALATAEAQDSAAPVEGEEVQESEIAPAVLAEEPWPDWILRPPGMVGQLTDYINQTAGCPQPKLAVGAALVACGTLFGRKVRDESGGRTNIYMIAVVESSGGKDHPGDCVQKLFTEAGADMLIGGSRVTSDSAIETSLSLCPVQFYIFDEAGHMFGSIKSANANGAGHLRTIVPTLMELYSSAHKMYRGKQRAQEELRRIDQPHVCIWGMTTPATLYDGLSSGELEDGWLGRMIVIASEARPRYKMVRETSPPESLVTMAQAWFLRQVPAPDGHGDLMGALRCHQICIPAQEAAFAVLESFSIECHDNMIACAQRNDPLQYLWGKAFQNARRIALTLAAGDRFDNAEITEEHALYACEFIRLTLRDFARGIEANVADSEHHRQKMKILKIIAQRGESGISKQMLTRRTQYLKDSRERDGYIQDLENAGLIRYGLNGVVKKVGWLWKI